MMPSVEAAGAITIVSLTFDDGLRESAAIQPLLDSGLKATFYVNSNEIRLSGPIDNTDFLTKGELDTLFNNGYEIGGHTIGHVDLATLSDAAQKKAICDDLATLRNWYGDSVYSFAYPYGSSGPTTQSIIAGGCPGTYGPLNKPVGKYESARAAGGLGCQGCPIAETLPPANRYYIYTAGDVVSSTTLAQIQKYVTQAETNGGGWVTLFFHSVCNGCDTYSMTQGTLVNFLTWLKAREPQGTYVRTVHQVMSGDYPTSLPPPSNTAPTFVGGITTLTMTQGDPALDLKANLHVSDADTGQTETWSQSVAPVHGTLTFSGATASSGSTDITPGGTITYQPVAGYSGSDSFTVLVKDGVASATRAFVVNVIPSTNTNTTPTFVGGTTSLQVGMNNLALDLKPNLHVSDTDAGQTETWSSNTAPTHGSLVITGATANSGSADITPSGTLTYQPAAGYSGSDSFTVQVSDGVASATRTFAVTVTANTDTNLLINPSLEVLGSNNFPNCWEGDGYGTNTATWTRTTDAFTGSSAQKLQITAYTNGDRKLMPTLDAGQTSGGCAPSVEAGANYQISAYYKSTTTSTVLLFYLDANGVWQYWRDGPILPASNVWTQMTHYTGTLPAGAKAISFGIGLASIGTLTTDEYAMTKVLDGSPPTNTAPTFVGGSTTLNVKINSPALDLKPNLHVSDTNTGQTETWTQSVAPAHGTLTFSNATASSGSTNITPGGTITYQPVAGYSGSDSFTVQVSDGVAIATRTFTVTVTANTAPTFVGGTTTLSVRRNSSALNLKPNLHVSDTDTGQTETWSRNVAPAHGTLTITSATASSGSTNITPGGTITYKPATGYRGSDSFKVQVSDGVATAIRTFAVTVQ